jgi:hypothetical protein
MLLPKVARVMAYGSSNHITPLLKTFTATRRQWFTPIILATSQAEIGRIVVQGQPREIVPETLPPAPK